MKESDITKAKLSAAGSDGRETTYVPAGRIEDLLLEGTEKRRVLIIDDNELDRTLLSSLLKEEYAVITAANGQEGLQVLKDRSGEISVVLLDLIMPVMDGYAVLQAVRGEPETASVPVVITTAKNSVEDEIRALEYGATAFISKPYNRNVILNRIRALIRLSDSTSILRIAERDRVTGVYNPTFFYGYAKRIMDATPDSDYDIVVTNIEAFRKFNEQFGWEGGNRILRQIAKTLQADLKEGEIMGRLMGDHFATLRHRQSELVAEAAVKRLNEAVSRDLSIPVTLRYGVYRVDDRDKSVDSMCDKATAALKTIYGRYGDDVAYFNDALREKELEEQKILDIMEDALKQEEFVVYYQPKHDVRAARTGGAEALVRWNSPEIGFVSPGTFIPLFERNGFITKMDCYVWEEVAKHLAERIAAGQPVVPVSVNISRMDFSMPQLDAYIRDICDRYRIPHELLHLELTESAYAENPAVIASIISSLRDQGFVVELDDFGTGYSTLSALSDITFDVLKLDISLVQGMEQPKKKLILSHVSEMAASLGIQTVAEGCETAEQAAELKNLGVTYIQGYYYSKPLPLTDFEAYMNEKG